MKFIPLAVISLFSIVYAIYTKDNEVPFKFGEFEIDTSIRFEYLLKSLFKLKHVFHYIITYWLGLYAFGKDEHRKVILFCLVLGLFIEVLQGFVPSRGGAFSDLVPNVLGMLIGFVAQIIFRSYHFLPLRAGTSNSSSRIRKN